MKEILMSAIALLENIRPLKDTCLNNTISNLVRQLTEKFLEDSLANCGALLYGLTSEEKELADKCEWSDRARYDYNSHTYIGGDVYPKKIEAIKVARKRLGLGLKEAKDLVEGYINRDDGEVARRLGVGK